MSDVELWICFNGPEPEHIRPLLDTIRDLPPATPEQRERAARRFFEALDASLAQSEEPPAAPLEPIAQCEEPPAAPIAPLAQPTAPPTVHRPSEHRPTARSPHLHDPPAADPSAADPPAAAAPPAIAPPPPAPIAPSPPFDARAPRPPERRPPQALVNASLALDIPAEFRAKSFDAREPRPPERRPPQALINTAPAIDIPAELHAEAATLPFRPPSAANELARTMQSPVHDPRKGQTVGIGDDAIPKAVAMVPFAGNTVGAGVVPIPRLSLEQYAYLRAELAAYPEREPEILLQYRVVNDAARRALDEHWQTQLAESPEARATFENALASHTARLHAGKP